MRNPKLIDNKRVSLAEILKKNVVEHQHLSIATGYWDLEGTSEIIDGLFNYESVRLLIGQEPFTKNSKIKNIQSLDLYSEDFPETEIQIDLEFDSKKDNVDQIRNTAAKLVKLIENGILKVKIMRKPRLHAKAYIFGDYNDDNAIGIIGSSNFTNAGLTSSAELNSLEDQPPMVVYEPKNEKMPHTHLSWFNELWDDPDVLEWSGEFKELLEKSPVGDKTFGPYDVYIKTLMEVFPDELLPPKELTEELQDVLYAFQNRNAGILINKLEKMGVAILSDSVGLGKTITGGAVVKHYLDMERTNIQIITPASLKQQWIDDLSSILGLEYREGHFNIVSQQDINAIQGIKEYYDKEWRRTKQIDLFVIDEAHNLRSSAGTRHDAILELLQQHPKAHILLLTATPINNTLLDIANQIQLASKGKLTSVNVPYTRPGSNQIEMVDFFEALKRIQSALKKSAKNGEKFDYESIKPTIHSGLRYYLVRSTRQGVEAEGSMIDRAGKMKRFPKSSVQSINYKYEDETLKFVLDVIDNYQSITFEEINPRKLNLAVLSEFTQQSMHPLDFLKEGIEDLRYSANRFNILYDDLSTKGEIIVENQPDDLVGTILKVIFTLGFTPYRPEVYKHKYYGKTMEEIRSFSNNFKLGIQLTVHNILQVTWLKRLESSVYALFMSIENYRKRIDLFEKYLDLGYVVSLGDASLLENDYNDGEDIEKAFRDYDEYLKNIEAELNDESGKLTTSKKGVEKVKADPKVYNIEQIKKDIGRDKNILDVLKVILRELSKPKHNTKMHELANVISMQIANQAYGKKVLVFSFFADTIEYLEQNLFKLLEKKIPNFKDKAAFITGNTNKIEQTVRRFSPRSKKYKLSSDETELDYLFATDVLSEGQNLQDAGILINFDLHWNPVRMIQRNGRINRLGSLFDDVLIGNMKPDEELELYLRLVNRLETKINTIKNTIGLDQGVLDSSDVNPIEFIEKYYDTGELPEPDDDLLAHTDEHILELRKFLGKNAQKLDEIERVKAIPIGKWNYLPQSNTKKNYALALMNTLGRTTVNKTRVEDNYFIEVECKDGYIASHIELARALDVIKTDESDNEVERDVILFDRNKVNSRSKAEARRQAENPTELYELKPKMLEALVVLREYYPPGIDLRGVIENNVKDTKQKRELEKILRDVNKETRIIGSPNVATINKFTKLFNTLNRDQVEEKLIEEVEGVLFYASRS
jgi:ERCC4-related helicase